jgi:hypothetical protein
MWNVIGGKHRSICVSVITIIIILTIIMMLPIGLSSMQVHPAPDSKRSSQLHKMYQSRCTAKNSWWWAERLPETCRVVIPIKLEFSASVGVIHKESLDTWPCQLVLLLWCPTVYYPDHKGPPLDPILSCFCWIYVFVAFLTHPYKYFCHLHFSLSLYEYF